MKFLILFLLIEYCFQQEFFGSSLIVSLISTLIIERFRSHTFTDNSAIEFLNPFYLSLCFIILIDRFRSLLIYRQLFDTFDLTIISDMLRPKLTHTLILSTNIPIRLFIPRYFDSHYKNAFLSTHLTLVIFIPR